MEIKNHFGVYGVCLQEGKLLCIEKTRGPYQHRFDLPGGSQEVGEGLTETLKNPFLMKFLMEVMIQQMPFGFLLSRLPKKMPPL